MCTLDILIVFVALSIKFGLVATTTAVHLCVLSLDRPVVPRFNFEIIAILIIIVIIVKCQLIVLVISAAACLFLIYSVIPVNLFSDSAKVAPS